MPVKIELDPEIEDQDLRFIERNLAVIQEKYPDFLWPEVTVKLTTKSDLDRPKRAGVYDNKLKQITIYNVRDGFEANFRDVLLHELFHARSVPRSSIEDTDIFESVNYMERKENPLKLGDEGLDTYKKLKQHAAFSGYPSAYDGELSTEEFLATFIPDMNQRMKEGYTPARTQKILDFYSDEADTVFFANRYPEINSHKILPYNPPGREDNFWDKIKSVFK